MTDERREIVELLLADRQFIYSLFHKLFGREPDADIMDILTSSSSKEAFGILSEAEGDILGRAPRFFEELGRDMEDPAFLDKLKSEYTRLFIGPIKLVAPPWESIYNGEDAMLFQESTLRVREYYRSFNLLPQGYPRVADDSLALELAFMSELANRALEAFKTDDSAGLKRCLDGSRVFLKAHLLVWIPKFLKKMEETTTTYMYPQLCVILDSFLKKDYEILQTVQDELEA